MKNKTLEQIVLDVELFRSLTEETYLEYSDYEDDNPINVELQKWQQLSRQLRDKDNEKHFEQYYVVLRRLSDKKKFFCTCYEGPYVDDDWYTNKNDRLLTELDSDDDYVVERHFLSKDLDKIKNSKLDYEKRFKKLWKLVDYNV
jgi:hypothetical protein